MVRIISFCWIVIWALCFSQLPLFMTQYEMRLQGHVAEITKVVEKMRKSAGRSGLTIEEQVKLLRTQPTPAIQHHGECIQSILFRQQTLARSLHAVDQAHPLAQPFIMIFYVDREIFLETWKGFSPGFLWNKSGVFWCVMGAVFAIVTLWLPQAIRSQSR